MDYRTVRGIFFAEPKPGAPPPLAITTGTRARRLRDAMEPLACQSIWSEEAAERYVELGLGDWFAAYIWERTAALGTPPTALAVMAMGVWNAELIGPLFDKAVAAISRDDIVATRLTLPGVTVRRLLGDIDHRGRPGGRGAAPGDRGRRCHGPAAFRWVDRRAVAAGRRGPARSCVSPVAGAPRGLPPRRLCTGGAGPG